MNYNDIATSIIALKDADLKLRNQLMQAGQLNEGYNEEMAQLHHHNAEALNEIIDNIGYPTSNKVGKEASEAAWLVIQHAIGQPTFMRKCVGLLEEAVGAGLANPKSLAYLTDRIAVFEGKPQRYGTQFDWDENGVLSPKAYDDLNEVNRRRKAVGLNTLAEQTAIIRRQAREENHLPPADLAERRREYEEWRRKVGWIS